MESWKLSQGTPLAMVVTICDANGNALAYEGTEPLACTVSAGVGQPSLFTPSATWATAANGTVNVAITGEQTSAVEPAQYLVILEVSGYVAYMANLVIGWAVGTEPTRPTYITIDDLRKECGWVEDLQANDFYSAGFLDQCADAREWFDECILMNYAGTYTDLFGDHGLALNAWFGGGARKSQAHNLYLAELLANNCLIVGTRVKKVMALYALHLIFKANPTRDKTFLGLAAMYLHQCYALMTGTRAEIDISGAGAVPNLVIHFSQANALEA